MSLERPRLADVGTLIRSAKLAEAVEPVCLDGELAGRYEELERKLREIPSSGNDSLASPAAAIRAEMNEARGRMLESTVDFVFRALPARKFRDLKAAHPPRKDNNGLAIDRDYLGVNYETFMDALVRACLVEPKLDDETLTLLLEERLTDGQYERLTTVCWNLNRSTVNVPFLQAASPSQTTSGSE